MPSELASRPMSTDSATASLEPQKTVCNDSSNASRTTSATKNHDSFSKPEQGQDVLSQAIFNPSFHANPDAKLPKTGRFYQPPAPKLKLKVKRTESDEAAASAPNTEEKVQLKRKRGEKACRTSITQTNSRTHGKSDVQATSHTVNPSSPKTLIGSTTNSDITTNTRRILARARSPPKFHKRETDLDVSATVQNMAANLGHATMEGEITEEERARRKHIIAKLTEGDGPTINNLLPTREIHTLADIYYQVVNITDEDYKCAVRENLYREETGLYLTSTPQVKIRLQGEPCPLDFRAFPDTTGTAADEDAGGEHRAGPSSSAPEPPRLQSSVEAVPAPAGASAMSILPAGDIDS